MPKSRTLIAGALLAMGLALTWPHPLAAQRISAASHGPAASSLDPAYVRGYQEGYAAGRSDQRAGVPANFHKFLAWQLATDGYQRAAGSPSAYQQAFRGGFQDGYGDGYAGRAYALPSHSSPAGSNLPRAGWEPLPDAAPPASATPAASSTPVFTAPAPTPAQIHRSIGIGYHEGYSAGQYDADRGAPNAPQSRREYREASAGYTHKLGSFAAFQKNFRQGFREGYADGYRRRLYNSQIGVRHMTVAPAAAPAPAAPEPAGASPPPTGENLRLRAGTVIHCLLDEPLSTNDNYVGDAFSATVSIPVYAGGQVVLPAGSKIYGVVTQLKRGGFFSGSASMTLQYKRISVPGGASYAFAAVTAGVGPRSRLITTPEGGVGQKSRTAQDAKRIGGQGAAGAIIGGILGGGRGAMMGGVIGAASGAAGVLISRKRDIKLYSGEDLALQLTHGLAVQPVNGGLD